MIGPHADADKRPVTDHFAGENRLLKMIAEGHPLGSILDGLCRLVEARVSGSFVSILTPDGDRFGYGAPRRSEGSRGTCWSAPIRSSGGDVLGTLAILSREPGQPGAQHQYTLERATHFASIAIESTRTRDALQESERRFRQVTESMKQSEKDLRRSEGYLAQAQQLSRVGSFGWNVSTGELFWSEETYRLLEVDRSSRPTIDLVLQRVHPEDLAFVTKTLARAREGAPELDFEHRVVTPDGSVKHVHVLARAMKGQPDCLEYVGAAMDVTKQHQETAALERAFDELHVSEEQLRTTVNALPTLAFSCHPDGSTEFINEQWLSYTGLSLSDALGCGWGNAIHPEDLPRLLETWRQIRESRRPGELEARLRRFDGVYRWFLFRARPALDQHGDVLRWYGTNTDIDDLKRSEAALRDTHIELARVTRVKTLGELTASIAHEINQPLAAIIAEASACKNWLTAARPDLDSAREAVDDIVKDGARAAGVLDRIRALLSRSSVVRVRCDLADVIRDILPLVRPQLARYGVVLETSLPADAPKVIGNPVELQQVVLNLVLNAGEASREVAADRRRVVVRLAAEEGAGGVCALVAVEDAGVGIDERDAERLFEAFYSTKPDGMGMGLSISRSIVECHGGRLWATANAQHGSTFRFALPGVA